jgi:hypothetical protein
MLQKLKVSMKCPTYYFEGPFRWAQHHQVQYVSMKNHLRVVKSSPIVINPFKSFCNK